MLPVPGQEAAICSIWQEKLDGPEATTSWCALNEVYPMELRDQASTAGVLIEARLLPAVEIPPQRRFLAASSSGGLGGCSGPGRRSPGNRAERGGLGADRQEVREIRPSRKRFKAPQIYRTRSSQAGNPAYGPAQGRGRGDFAGGPDVETAIRTTGLLTAGRNPGGAAARRLRADR